MHLFTRKSHAGSYLRSFNRQAVRVEAEAEKRNVVPADMDGGVARQFEASGVPTSGTRPGNTCASPTGIKACDLIGSRCVAMSVEHPAPLASSIPQQADQPTPPSVMPPAFNLPAPAQAVSHAITRQSEHEAADRRTGHDEARDSATLQSGDGVPDSRGGQFISEATDHKMVSNLDGEKPTGAQGCYQSAGSVASA
jgi:hypothetical protein